MRQEYVFHCLLFYGVLLIILLTSIWALSSQTGTMSMPVLSNAILAGQIQMVVLASTSTSGVLWSTEFPPLTLAVWCVNFLYIYQYINTSNTHTKDFLCSQYFIVADESTAVNTGQGNLTVTFSRGYKRNNYVIDGGFEGYNECDFFCFTQSYTNWIGTNSDGGFFDATIFYFPPYAHHGNGVGLLGSAYGSDSLPGTLTPAQPLRTVAGQKYTITFFQASAFSGPDGEAPAFIDILWNGDVVSTLRPGFSNYEYNSFDVVGAGDDVLAFHGGAAPAWTFIDDIAVYQI